MASQIIKLPDQLYLDFFHAHWNLYHPLLSRGIDMSHVGPSGDGVFCFSVSCKEMGLRSRPIGQESFLAFVIAPHDVDFERSCWPKPLSSQHVVAIIDEIQAVIDASDDFSGHDRIALGEYFQEARTGIATGLRPIEPSSSCSPWHPTLLAEAQALSASFASAIADLEPKLEAYRSRLVEADCEAILLGLSSYAELASCAHFAPRQDDSGTLLLKETGISRRGSLRRSIDCAMQLADAYQATLRRADPFSNAYGPLETIRDLVAIHDEIQPTARSQRGIPRWRQHCWIEDDDGIAGKLPVRGLTPLEAVPDATEIWLADRKPGCWPDVHPLVRALFVHMRFLWIRPFQSENGRIARLLLAADLQAAGWPLLPLEMAIERHYGEYVEAIQDALRLKSHEGLLLSMMRIVDDAIAIGDQLIEVIVTERTRLAIALRHPNCLGPALEPEAAQGRAEELLGGLLIEAIPHFKGGRFLLKDLSHLGLLERVSSPIGTVFGVPSIRRLVSALVE